MSRPTMRELLTHALTNEKKADAMLAFFDAFEASYNQLLVKLDADTGVTATDFEDTLKVDPLDK